MSDLAVGLVIVGAGAVFSIGVGWMGWVSITLVKILQGITRNDAHNDEQDNRLTNIEDRLEVGGL